MSNAIARNTRKASTKVEAPKVEAPKVEAPKVEAPRPTSPGLAALAGLVSIEQREAAQRAAYEAIGADVPDVLPTGGYNAGRVTPGTHANGYRAARDAKGYGRVALAQALGVKASVVWHNEFNATGADLAEALRRLAALPDCPKRTK